MMYYLLYQLDTGGMMYDVHYRLVQRMDVEH